MRWAASIMFAGGALCQDPLPIHLPIQGAIEGTIAPGETRTYAVEPGTGSYAELRVEGRGARLEIEAPAVRRRILDASDAMPATLCWVDGEGGSGRVVVKSLERKAVRKFGLLLTARQALEADHMRARGCSAAAEATGIAQPEQRLEKLQSALREFASAGDSERQGETLTAIGQAQWELAHTADSIASHEKAVEAWERAGNSRRKAAAAHKLAAGYLLTNRPAQGKAVLRMVERLAKESGDGSLEADALSDLALQISREGGYAEAASASDRAIRLKVEAGDRKGEADAQNLRAMIQQNAGSLDDALARYGRALALREELDDEAGQAQILNNQATVYGQLAEPLKAIATLERALEIRKRLAGPQAVANTRHNLGVQHTLAGEFDRALEMFDEALTVWRQAKNLLGEASTLAERGQVLLRLGETDRAARAYGESLELHRRLKNRRGEANAILGLGTAMRQSGQNGRSAELCQSAYEIAREGKFPQEELRALQGLGRARSGLGRHEEAIAALRQAVELGEKTNRQDALASRNALGAALLDASRRGEAAVEFGQALVQAQGIESRGEEFTARAGLARIAEMEGDFEAARREAAAAVELVEDLRTNVASADLRASYLSRTRGVYGVASHALMRLGHTRAAFEMSERGRARALLDLLSAGRIPPAPGSAPAEERRAREMLNAKAGRLTRMLTRGATAQETIALRREISSLLDAHAALRERMARENPAMGSVGAPATAEEIQKRLAPGDALYEISLGEERSFGWLVTRDSLRGVTLAPRRLLEGEASRLRAEIETPLDALEGETAAMRRSRLADAGANANKAAARLKALLGLPDAGFPVRKLYVVADGGLHYAPMAAMGALGSVDVAMLPSASVLTQLTRRAGPLRSAAVFADPVYETSDERFESGTSPGAVSGDPAVRASEDPLRFPRLRFSRKEAEAIAGLTTARAGLVATGFAATRQAALKAALGVDVVHFAAHAVLNERDPELSAIVLSLFDERGRATDGFLRLSDVARMPLASQLVVLSACQTALGQRLDGEGLIGFTRSFLAAGASGVVASLWRVDDAATAEWMKVFYDALLRRKLSVPAAARAAQEAIRSQPKWSHPFYWAGFVYLGV